MSGKGEGLRLTHVEPMVGGVQVGADAIIAYFLYNVLVSRINKVVMLLEVRSMEFMDLLHEPA